MASRAAGVSSRARAAALLLVVALAAPAGEHLYWALGGTWGLHRSVNGHIEETTTTGIRIVAAVVVVLVVAGALVVLTRVGWWQQAFVPDRVIGVLAWGLAGFFLFHSLVSFGRYEYEWWLYGPGGLVIGLLALVVAGSGGAWRLRRPRARGPVRVDH